MHLLVLVLTIVGAGLVLNACGGGGGGAGSSPPPGGSTNQSPMISGAPSGTVMQGTQYTFTPAASDADGDVLTFSIANKPSWATFIQSTGVLSGTPAVSDIGVYPNITISVTDGPATASLAAFNLVVVATATGSATLSWTAPTVNADGSPLTDLAGFKVYWGTSLGNYPNSHTIDNPSLATYMVEQLTPATWFFVTTAFDHQGAESSFSNVASKTVP